jgi:ribosomal protein S18 acetylase RimI-like enzyme
MNAAPKKKSISRFWQKVLIKVRYGMVIQVIKRRIIRIGIEISPYYLFLEGAEVTNIPAIKDLESDCSIEIFLPEDMALMKDNDSGFSYQDFLNFLEDGQKCIGIKHKGKVAAFMWINFNDLKYKSFHMQLKSNEAYLWSMFTMEEYRGKNLAPFLRYKSYEILHEMGKDTLYSVSEYFNTPAIRFKQKLNARILNLLLYIRFFKMFERNFTLRSYYKK